MKHPSLLSTKVLLSLGIAGFFLLLVGGVCADNSDRPFGDSKVFTKLPAAPGFPESIAVNGNKVYVAGPAAFGTAGSGPSKILAYDIRTGDFIREYVVQGQDLGKEHVVAGIAFDKDDRIYAVDTQQGIIRLTLDGQSQEVYASPLPDLPTCSSVPTGTPCSPTLVDNIPIPNDIAFDDNGNLYWTDSFQRTPPLMNLSNSVIGIKTWRNARLGWISPRFIKRRTVLVDTPPR